MRLDSVCQIVLDMETSIWKPRNVSVGASGPEETAPKVRLFPVCGTKARAELELRCDQRIWRHSVGGRDIQYNDTEHKGKITAL